MTGQPIKAGDVVKLKSGGPQMTVEDTDGQRVKVVWMEKGKVMTRTFETAILKHAAKDA